MSHELRASIAAARSALEEDAERTGRYFATVGVAIDWSLDEGIQFLQHVGPFNEVMIGRNWLNNAIVRYAWQQEVTRAAVPQILVLERRIRVDDLSIKVDSEELLRRVIGVDSIAAWVQAGAPVRSVERRTTF